MPSLANSSAELLLLVEVLMSQYEFFIKTRTSISETSLIWFTMESDVTSISQGERVGLEKFTFVGEVAEESVDISLIARI